jgi:hypothetical protein
MLDRTDHNKFADELAQRFVDHRVRELKAFEARASGPSITLPSRPTTAAKVATEGTFTMSPMSVFQPAANKSAFLKMGIMGKQGAGKTKTAGKVAIGLVQHLKKMGITYASKPVAFFDTETGSDFLIPDFEAAGIPFVVAKTKTLADLVKAMDEAEVNCSVLIIDSITHPYREMIAAYLKKKNRTFLQIDDYQYLKGDYGWAMFTNRFINSKLHIIMCGRAGDDLEQYTDEQGKRQLEKVGVKMKGEAETGFEPSLLIEMKLMERNNREQTGRKRTFVNMATVVKDRWDQINGDEIDNPDFADFLPHINLLAIGGEHLGVRSDGDSQSILKTEKRDWQPVQRKIVLGELQDLLVQHAGGQAIAEKQRRIALLKTHFGGCGYVEIEETMPLVDLRAGFDSLHRELEGQPSKYASAMEKDMRSNDLNDSLPAELAAPRDNTPSPELLASRLVVEATKPVVDTETLAPDGIPAFLDRREPVVPSFDESKWLAELTKAFDECLDFVSFGQKQQEIMNPARPQVTAPTWAKALKLAKRCTARLFDTQSEPAFATAAE